MLYDTFVFFNELELLDIRLHELDSIVDKFVLVESTVTFTNKKKPLYYEKNKSNFKKYHKKIHHIVVEDSPNVDGNAWIIENYQYSEISRGLTKCRPSDQIMLSFLDEIPKAITVSKWINKPGKHKAFEQALSYYYLNYFVVNDSPWLGTRLIKYKDLLKYKSTYVARFSRPDLQIPDGGWHFSYIGGVKKIQEKLSSFSHQEFNNSKYNTEEKILLAMQEGKDLFNRGYRFQFVDISKMPKFVQDNEKNFGNLLVRKANKNNFYTSYLKAKREMRDKVKKILLR